MSGSTQHLDTISASQSSKETTANELFDAMSTPTLYGRRASTTSGLTWGFYGGPVVTSGGTIAFLVNSIVTLTASLVNYLEAKKEDGTLVRVSSQFTPGRYACYKVYTNSGGVNSYEDFRTVVPVLSQGMLRAAVNSITDADQTLSHAQAACRIIEFNGTLTASRNIVVPDGPQEWVVYNNTAQTLTIKTSGGTGVPIATTKRAIVYADGTNVARVTADT